MPRENMSPKEAVRKDKHFSFETEDAQEYLSQAKREEAKQGRLAKLWGANEKRVKVWQNEVDRIKKEHADYLKSPELEKVAKDLAVKAYEIMEQAENYDDERQRMAKEFGIKMEDAEPGENYYNSMDELLKDNEKYGKEKIDYATAAKIVALKDTLMPIQKERLMVDDNIAFIEKGERFPVEDMTERKDSINDVLNDARDKNLENVLVIIGYKSVINYNESKMHGEPRYDTERMDPQYVAISKETANIISQLESATGHRLSAANSVVIETDALYGAGKRNDEIYSLHSNYDVVSVQELEHELEEEELEAKK